MGGHRVAVHGEQAGAGEGGGHGEEVLGQFGQWRVAADDPLGADLGQAQEERPAVGASGRVELLVDRLGGGAECALADSTVSTYIQRVRAKYEAVGRPARTKVRLLIRAVEDGYVRLDDL